MNGYSIVPIGPRSTGQNIFKNIFVFAEIFTKICLSFKGTDFERNFEKRVGYLNSELVWRVDPGEDPQFHGLNNLRKNLTNNINNININNNNNIHKHKQIIYSNPFSLIEIFRQPYPS